MLALFYKPTLMVLLLVQDRRDDQDVGLYHQDQNDGRVCQFLPLL